MSGGIMQPPLPCRGCLRRIRGSSPASSGFRAALHPGGSKLPVCVVPRLRAVTYRDPTQRDERSLKNLRHHRRRRHGDCGHRALAGAASVRPRPESQLGAARVPVMARRRTTPCLKKSERGHASRKGGIRGGAPERRRGATPSSFDGGAAVSSLHLRSRSRSTREASFRSRANRPVPRLVGVFPVRIRSARVATFCMP